MMKFSIFTICCFLLPNVHSLIEIALSYIKKWPLGTTFQPANSVESLSNWTTASFMHCGTKCNVNVQCRTYVHDFVTKQCSLYEGHVSTGTILYNSSTTRVGSVKYFPSLYQCYNKTNNQCSFNRYLVADNVSHIGACPINTYWNDTMCLNQVYFGASCTLSTMCRTDLALRCDPIANQTCTTAIEFNVVKNGDAETGSCTRSTGGVSPAFWSSTGLLTQLEYNNTDGAMTPTSPGPNDRGNCYFWGGTSSYVDMYQIVNLTGHASVIDQNKASYNFSAWVGGWGDQDDAATLWVNFYNANNTIIGNVTIPQVHPIDRLNITQLIYREVIGSIPIYTRYIKIYVAMIGTTFNNDASVDNISFIFRYIP